MSGARGARAAALIASLLLGPAAHAQPARGEPPTDPAGAADPEGPDADDVRALRASGFIGRERLTLDIDDCRPPDPTLATPALRALAAEHYERGETLYVQGDYDGAVTELVAAYCTVPAYVVLKSIGQAYERSLEYEKAIAYLERYAAAIGPDAKRASACAPDPQDDKANIERRVAVLQKLAARVQVETTPPGATITIASETGRAALARSGDQIDIPGGRYAMTIEREGYRPVTRTIDLRIGKPYTFFVQLEPVRGVLAVQVNPPDARVFLGDRLVGIGRFSDDLPGGEYTISAEAPGRVRVEKRVEVLPDQRTVSTLDLAPVPEVGRRQLVVAAAVGGGVAAGSLLSGFQGTSISGLGALVGSGAGFAGAYFALPPDLALGTSNLTITSGVGGMIAGAYGARLFTDREDVGAPLLGAGLLLGAAGGYLAGERLGVTPGEAAVFNSALAWGTTTGALFSLSFDPGRATGAALVMSGLGMGAIGGVLLARAFPISRTHALLIDIGGIAGMVGGLAVESVAFSDEDRAGESAARATERAVHFVVGGMAIGLVTAGVLTRNLDEPKLPVRPSVGAATRADGRSVTTFGVAGAW